jgi:hypothetical protein
MCIIQIESPRATIKLMPGKSQIEAADNDSRKYLAEVFVNQLMQA